MSWDDSCDLEYALAEFKAENERLQAENDSLRKELAVNEPLFETLNAANDRLIYENMKLRELVCDMWHDLQVHGYKVETMLRARYEHRMCELGVEV